MLFSFFFFFQAEDGIRDHCVTGVQTCALPISPRQHGTTVVRARFHVQATRLLRSSAPALRKRGRKLQHRTRRPMTRSVPYSAKQRPRSAAKKASELIPELSVIPNLRRNYPAAKQNFGEFGPTRHCVSPAPRIIALYSDGLPC